MGRISIARRGYRLAGILTFIFLMTFDERWVIITGAVGLGIAIDSMFQAYYWECRETQLRWRINLHFRQQHKQWEAWLHEVNRQSLHRRRTDSLN